MAHTELGKHYGNFDTWDFLSHLGHIELELGFILGNIHKYVTRAGKKEGEYIGKDLKKAHDYIDRFKIVYASYVLDRKNGFFYDIEEGMLDEILEEVASLEKQLEEKEKNI